MKRGVAFIHGVGMDGTDTVIFEPDGHYASVGKRIERQLERCLDEPFSVTTRRIQTVALVAARYGYNLKYGVPYVGPLREPHDTD